MCRLLIRVLLKAFCMVQVQDQRSTGDKEHAALAGDGPVVPRSPFEDMKVSLIDVTRTKSGSRCAHSCSVFVHSILLHRRLKGWHFL